MIQKMLEEALEHHKAGRLSLAEAQYRKALDLQPDNSDALHFLGLLASRVGHHEPAIELIRKAINIHPVAADYHASLGFVFAAAGRPDEAIIAYREALSISPRHSDALNNMGSVLMQKGMVEEAVAHYRQFAAIHPNSVEAHYNLGVVLQKTGEREAAIDEYRRAIALGSTHPDVYLNLGTALGPTDPDAAVEYFCKALQSSPQSAEAIKNLTAFCASSGKWDTAISTLRQILSEHPDLVELEVFLTTAMNLSGRSDEAVEYCRRQIDLRHKEAELEDATAKLAKSGELTPKHAAILEVKWIKALANIQFSRGRFRDALKGYQTAATMEQHVAEHHFDVATAHRQLGQFYSAIEELFECLGRKDDYPEAHLNIGNLFFETGQLDRAIIGSRRAIELRPDYVEAHYNLGNYLAAAGDLDGAIQSLQKALELQPGYAQACNNLANTLKDARRIPEAIAMYDRALQIDPTYTQAASNRLFTLNFDPATDVNSLRRELSVWNQVHAMPLAGQILPHANVPDPNRRLRVGYVSPDFRQHVVGWNLLPLLGHHNHQQFEIYCYSSVIRPDDVTEKLKANADVWRNVAGTGDEKLAEVIRQDQIDLLVDLSLHSAQTRLLLFARKPAPLQLTYLGYCGSTGMTAMDYRFSDPYLDPPGEPPYAEKTLRLPRTYWCYQPGGQTPEPGPLPVESRGAITFGSLNNFAKISAPALDLWAGILNSVPDSRMMLYAMAGNHRQAALDRLQELGVSADRVEFVPPQRFEEFIQNYLRIDIALDPFPYGGGINTCDALWMGVPVITLAGRTPVGRAGVSILSNIGLQELIAKSPEQYGQLAVALATDLPRLSKMRQSLRGKMKSSALMDAVGFARDVEAAYRGIWKKWCDEHRTDPAKSVAQARAGA